MTPRLILVTGAGGFVGTHLRAVLAARMPDAEITGLGLPGGTPETGDHPIDITDAAALDAAVAALRPDVVVHLAAQASVAQAQAGASETWRANLGGTLNLALAVARHVPEAMVLFASTSEVYGHAFTAGPADEATVCEPANPYARSKLLAERVLADVLPASARLVVARPFNHTGPGQRETFVLPSFAGQIARIEAGLQPPALVCGNLAVSRDFLDVRDVASAYVALVEAAPDLPARFTCNVASGSARALSDVVEIMRRHARVPFTVEVDPARLRASDVPLAVGRADRLRSATGWRPRIAFEDTIAALMADARARSSAR